MRISFCGIPFLNAEGSLVPFGLIQKRRKDQENFELASAVIYWIIDAFIAASASDKKFSVGYGSVDVKELHNYSACHSELVSGSVVAITIGDPGSGPG